MSWDQELIRDDCIKHAWTDFPIMCTVTHRCYEAFLHLRASPRRCKTPSNCDVRLWNGKVNQRLNSPEKADFTFGEHIRAHAPGSADWKNLSGNRSLAESLNSVLKNDLGRGERARSLNLNHQWIDLVVMLLMRNDQSLMLYRRRTQLARTASPPAA